MSNVTFIAGPIPSRAITKAMWIKALFKAKRKDGLDPSSMAPLPPLGLSQLVFVLTEWTPHTKASELLINTESKLRRTVKDRAKQIGPGLHGLDPKQLKNLAIVATQRGWEESWMDMEHYAPKKIAKPKAAPKAGPGQLIGDTSALNLPAVAVDKSAFYGKLDIDILTKCGRFYNSKGVWQWVGFPNEDATPTWEGDSCRRSSCHHIDQVAILHSHTGASRVDIVRSCRLFRQH